MAKRHWEELYSTLEIRLQPGWMCLQKPTENDLAQFEIAHDFRLPTSYRSFITLFGAGDLAFDFRLLAPGCQASPQYDLQHFNHLTQLGFTATFLQFFSDPEQVKRLVYFAIPESADLIGWDPEDVRDLENHEYGIYELGPGEDLELIASSFAEFIDRICLADLESMAFPGWYSSLFKFSRSVPRQDRNTLK